MADRSMNVKLLNLTKTTSEWASFTTVIPKGMLCVEQIVSGQTVVGTKTKVGDGENTFANLPYVHNEPTMIGATSSTNGTGGLVPAPSAGDQTKFLTGGGTWESVEIAAPLQYRVIAASRSVTTNATDKFKLQVSSDSGVTWTDVDTDTSGVVNVDLGLFATTASGDDEIGKIKSILLPSYVDDIIEGYYYNNKFWMRLTLLPVQHLLNILPPFHTSLCATATIILLTAVRILYYISRYRNRIEILFKCYRLCRVVCEDPACLCCLASRKIGHSQLPFKVCNLLVLGVNLVCTQLVKDSLCIRRLICEQVSNALIDNLTVRTILTNNCGVQICCCKSVFTTTIL